MVVRELRVTYELRPDLPDLDIGRNFNTPRDAASYLIPILQNEPTEVFLVVCLTAKYTALAYREIARGSVCQVHVSPAEIFKTVLLSNAAAFLIAHNHLSGDPSPSPDDLELTRRLIDGARLLDVALLDHIVVATNRYYSFKEGGQI